MIHRVRSCTIFFLQQEHGAGEECRRNTMTGGLNKSKKYGEFPFDHVFPPVATQAVSLKRPARGELCTGSMWECSPRVRPAAARRSPWMEETRTTRNRWELFQQMLKKWDSWPASYWLKKAQVWYHDARLQGIRYLCHQPEGWRLYYLKARLNFCMQKQARKTQGCGQDYVQRTVLKHYNRPVLYLTGIQIENSCAKR